jgi:hypothetical protein
MYTTAYVRTLKAWLMHALATLFLLRTNAGLSMVIDALLSIKLKKSPLDAMR